MKKVLYFDVETTGLDPVKNDIIQIAGIIEIDGVIQDEFEFKCQPVSFDPECISIDALETHGYNLEDLASFPYPGEIYHKLISIFSKYIDKYNKQDKFTPAGYNVRFDMEFLKEFFKKQGDIYFGSWINWQMVDPLPVLHFLSFTGKIPFLQNYKLSTICDEFAVEIEAHDALSDIRATRAVINQIKSII